MSNLVQKVAASPRLARLGAFAVDESTRYAVGTTAAIAAAALTHVPLDTPALLAVPAVADAIGAAMRYVRRSTLPAPVKVSAYAAFAFH